MAKAFADEFSIFKNLHKRNLHENYKIFKLYLNKPVKFASSVEILEPHTLQTFNLLSFFSKFEEKTENDKEKGLAHRKKKKIQENLPICKY